MLHQTRSPRRTVSAIPAAIGLMLVFLAMFTGTCGYFLAVGMQHTEERLVERSSAAAQVVATNAMWIAEVGQQTLRRVDAALGPTLVGDAASLKPVLEGLPALTDVYIIDAEARTIYSTAAGAQAVSVADRAYFTALRDGAPFYTSGLLISRLTGDRIFVFSKRMERAGVFEGEIMVSFPETLLRDLWGTLDLEQASTVSLIRSDGELIARYPPSDGLLNASQLPLFTEHLARAETGTYEAPRSPIDGVARTVSYRRVPGTNIIALAAVGSEEAWATFNAAIRAVLFMVAPIMLALLLGCAWIMRLLYRDARQARELQASVETNTMLFREIHHRVKNNLQSVQSLVRMQDLPDAAKRDLQGRFAAMAAMHEHIYQHDRYQDIDAHDFIPAVVAQVIAVYGSQASVRYALEHIAIDRDHATPLALLLSELVTNACKYAFPGDGVDAVITVTLGHGKNGRAALTVRDNGQGIDLARVEGGSMGMRLIRGLVAQIDGTYGFRNEGGTVFEADIALSTGARNR